MKTNEELGENLRRLRENQHLTRKALANALTDHEYKAVADSTIEKWECGKNAIPIAAVEPLSRALGCSLETLLCVENQ